MLLSETVGKPPGGDAEQDDHLRARMTDGKAAIIAASTTAASRPDEQVQ